MTTQHSPWPSLAADPAKAERIRQIARCPACKGTLEFSYPRIVCRGCGCEYAFEREVPYIITPQDRQHLQEFMATHTAQTVPAIHSKLRIKMFPPGPCHDPRRPDRLDKLWKRFKEDAVILDVGAQPGSIRPDIITFNMAPFRGMQLAGNALRLPIADESVDLIVNTGVLEHVEDIGKVVAEFHRVLKPGGLVYTEIPFMQGYHPDPTDFTRLTYEGLRKAFGAFVIEDMEVSSGPFSNLAWVVREAVACMFADKDWFTWAWILTGWATFWLKYFDAFAVHRPFAHRVASSYYVIARKD